MMLDANRANKLFDTAASIIAPPPLRTPDEWAEQNRILPPGSAEPGKFRTARTPYMIPIVRAIAGSKYKYITVVCGSQMGKTDNLLNIAGWRLDDDPAPILFVGPTQSNIQKVIEPRVMALIMSSRS